MEERTRGRWVEFGVLVSLIGGVVMLSFTPLAAAQASYTSGQAVSDSTSFVGQLATGIAPVMVAIATGVVGIAILSWGLRTVFRKVRGAAS